MNKFNVLCVATATLCAFNSSKTLACEANPFIGEVCPVAFNFAPRGWAFASGQLLPISQNTALFSILGTTYGGDGRTTFGLPDTRSRVVVSSGQGPGMSDYRLGQRGGVESVVLNVSQLPAHTHVATTTVNATSTIDVALSVSVSSGPANKSSPSGNVLATAPGTNTMYRAFDASLPRVTMNEATINYSLPDDIAIGASGSTTLTNTGGNSTLNNQSPTLGLYWVIALQGTFPSRS